MSQLDASYMTGSGSVIGDDRFPPPEKAGSISLGVAPAPAGGVSWKQEPIAAPAKRGWDWIYHSLWMASDGAKESCKVNIPSTVLFHLGDPRRWIETDDNGRAVRRLFPSPPKRSGGGKAVVRELRLRACWDGLLRFSEKMRRQGAGSPDKPRPVVVAWYRDGGKELLDVESWSRLMGHRNWTQQLIALQGYVHASSVNHGVYTAGALMHDSQIPSENRALDALTKGMAKYCEGAYARAAESSEKNRSIRNEPAINVPRLRVVKIKSSYILDPSGKLWLSHCEDVITQDMAAPAPDPVAQVALSAQMAATAESELRTLLRQATNRGVSVQTSFEHFDPKKRGEVSPEDFVTGMRKLGLALPPAAAEMFLSRIAVNKNGNIGLEEFSSFVFEAFALAYPDRAGTADSDIMMDSSPVSRHASRRALGTESNRGGAADRSPLQTTSSLGGVRSMARAESIEAEEAKYRAEIDLKRTISKIEDGVSSAQLSASKKHVRLVEFKQEDMLPSWARDSTHDTLAQLQQTERDIMTGKRKSVFGGSMLDPLGPVASGDEAVLNAMQAPGGPDEEGQPAEQGSVNGGEGIAGSEKSDDDALTLPDAGSLGHGHPLDIPVQGADDLPEDVDVFEVDKETTMLFKIVALQGVGGFDGIAKGKYSEAVAAAAAGVLRNIAILPGQDHLSIVLIPDFMETLDSMFDRVKFLFVRFPQLRVLMLQFPGQPGTRYRRSDCLNNKFLAKCLRSFLEHLRRERLWHWKPRAEIGHSDQEVMDDAIRRPMLLIANGNGANVVAYYTIFHMRQDPTSPLAQTLRASMFVNAFAYLDKVLTKNLKRCVQLCFRAVHAERMQNLCQMFFSQKYVDTVSRASALARFYSTRHVPVSMAQEGHDIDTAILHLLKGALEHVDLRPYLERMTIPVLFVHSSENVFVLPSHVETFLEAVGGMEKSAESIEKCLASRRDRMAMHISYLRAGHVVFEERDQAMRMIMERLTNGIEKGRESAAEEAARRQREVELEEKQAGLLGSGSDVSSVIETESEDEDEAAIRLLSQKEAAAKAAERKARKAERERLKQEKFLARKKKAKEAPPEPEKPKPFGGYEMTKKLERGIAKGGIEWVIVELEKRELSTEGDNTTLVKRLDSSFRAEKKAEHEKIQRMKAEAKAIKEAEEAEAQAAAKVAAREKRKDDAKRKAEMRAMREEEAEERAEERYMDELRSMTAEDVASRFQEEKYRLEQNLLEAGEKAKGFLVELREGREREIKMDKMVATSKKRAEKREQRNRRLLELKNRYQSQELHLEGDEHGYGLDADINSLDELESGCARLQKDMHEIRSRKSNTMIRHDASVKKRNQFEEKCRAIDKKIRDCRRAIRDTVKAIEAADKRGRRLPNGRRITAKEFKRQQEQREQERVALNEHRLELEQEEQDWKGQLNVATEEMHAIAGSVQRMTIVQRTKETELNSMIEKLQGLKHIIEKEKKALRRNEIKNARKFSTLKKDIDEREERLLKCQGELERCEICPTKFIDSNTWNSFRQRIKVVDLKKFLINEIGLLEEAIAEAQNQMKIVVAERATHGAADSRLAKALDITAQQLKNVIQCREDAHVPVAELMRRQKKLMEQAEGAAKDEELKKAEEARAAALGATSLADKIRIKAADSRLPHEKEFVAYDMLLHPEHYTHVNEVDEEIYRYDPGYQTTLTKEDLQRIVVLPEPLNLAMSFLKNETELKAHQCLQKFLFERGEDRLRDRDENVELQEAEAIEMSKMQNILETIKLRNERAQLRSKPKDLLTEEEAEWLRWDMQLHPHLFFGIKQMGFEPPNVDKKANAKKDEYIGKGKFEKRIAPIKSLENTHLLFLRSATDEEIIQEANASFQEKKYKAMRGTESQLFHVRNLLIRYGWDEYDAPESDSNESAETKALKEKERQLALTEGPETNIDGTPVTESKVAEPKKSVYKAKGAIKMRLTGLDFAEFQNSKTALSVVIDQVARAMAVDKSHIVIRKMESGSVILEFEVLSKEETDVELNNRLTAFESSVKNEGDWEESLQKAMDTVLDLDSAALNIANIEKMEVVSLEEKAPVDAKTAARMARKAERDSRRLAREKKKAESAAKKQAKKDALEAARLKEEEEEKKRVANSLKPELVPVQQWFNMLRSDPTFEDPRFQFGDPFPANSPGGIHVDIVSANNLKAMDFSFGGGSSDPYVKVTVGAKGPKKKIQTFKTKTIKKTLAPRWEDELKGTKEHFDFWRETQIETMGKSEVVVEMYDHDIGSGNDFMGELRFFVHELPFDRQGNLRPIGIKFEKDKDGTRHMKLQPRPGSSEKVQGTLSLRIWRTPSTDERADTMRYVNTQKAARAERAREIRLKATKQKIERQRLIEEAEEKNRKRDEALKKKREREKELKEKRKAKELARKEAELRRVEEEERKHREALALMPVQVINNISEIPEAVRRGPVLMRKRGDETPVVTLLDESEKSLAMRQSCWHEFVVPENSKSIEIRTVIIFKGVFTMRGYILGRISAALYRVPGNNAPPVSVGYSPAASCKLNTPETLGTIVIVHSPSANSLPVKPGRYRVVIGAASKTEYSITCSVRTAYTAEEACNARLKEAVEKSKRRPHTQQELYDLLMSIRLSERKYKLVEGLIADAEEECEKIQQQIDTLNKSLEFDENKDGLTDEEVKEIDMAIGRKELEFSGAVKRSMTRKQELRDIMHGLVRMAELKRERDDEMKVIDEFLGFQRRWLPKATATAVSIKTASEFAKQINARFIPDEHISHNRGEKAALEVAALGHMLTPAQKLRRRAQHLPHAGHGVLTEEESRWVAYDRVYNPFEWEEYTSGEDSNVESDEEEKELSSSDEDSTDTSKRRAKTKGKGKGVAVDRETRFVADVSKDDLVRIMASKPDECTVKEQKIRKLINKYHDRSIADVGPDIGQDTRDAAMKGGKHAKRLTLEQKEFLVYDQVLHPTWYPQVYAVDKWCGVDGIVGTGTQGHESNPGLKHDPEHEVHKRVIGEDKIEGEKRKKEEEDVKTATGGKVHLGRTETGEEHTVVVGPTPKQKLEAEIKYEQETHGLKENDPLWYEYKPPEALTLTQYDIQILMKKAKKDPKFIDSLDIRRKRVVHILDKFKPPPVHLGSTKVDRRGNSVGPMINFEARAAKVDLDIDRRCRTVQEELDLAYMCSTDFMGSDVMHSVPQKFPIDVLRADLERELDRLLVLQVIERERATKLIDSAKDYGEDASDSSDDENNEQARMLKRRRKAAAEMRNERRKKGIKVAGKGYAATMAGMSKKEQEEAQKKADLAQELAALGPNGCIACRKKECAWVEPVPYNQIQKRRHALDLERARIRNIDKATKMIESTVVRSVINGGIPVMTREDADHELEWELEYTFQLIKLHDIDKELHYAHSVRDDYCETEVLHGFKQMQWTKNVITALDRERNKIIALQLSNDIVDDILQWMLEGWYFGERESKLPAMGYVPSLKKDGPIRVHEAHLLSENGFPDRGAEVENRGKPEDKVAAIDADATDRIEKEKAVRAGSDQDHLLKQTETNLKFGIFSLTLQYFRAMTLVRRQYETWSGRKASMALEGKAPPREVTEEREKMEKEQNQLQLRLKKTEDADKKAMLGRERRNKRIQKERGQQRENMLVMVRRRNLEKAGAIKLQALYRGHLGRLAAMKWAVKKAEIDAMRALQHAAAVAIQRVWRGVMGRQVAEEKRIEMAEFIAQMRAAEAAEEEEEYWRTHTYERWKRDMRAWWKKKTGQETRITGAQRLAEEAEDMQAGEERLAQEEEEAAQEWENAMDSDDDDDWEPEGGAQF